MGEWGPSTQCYAVNAWFSVNKSFFFFSTVMTEGLVACFFFYPINHVREAKIKCVMFWGLVGLYKIVLITQFRVIRFRVSAENTQSGMQNVSYNNGNCGTPLLLIVYLLDFPFKCRTLVKHSAYSQWHIWVPGFATGCRTPWAGRSKLL